jgi:hypothetical protein
MGYHFRVVVRSLFAGPMQIVQIEVEHAGDRKHDQFLTGGVWGSYYAGGLSGLFEFGLSGTVQKPLLEQGLGFVPIFGNMLFTAGTGVRDAPDPARDLVLTANAFFVANYDQACLGR